MHIRCVKIVLEEFWVSPESQEEWTFCNDHIYGIATDWYRLLGIKLISWHNRSAHIGTSQKQQQSTTVLLHRQCHLGSHLWWENNIWLKPANGSNGSNLDQFHFGLPKKWTQQAFLDPSTGNGGSWIAPGSAMQFMKRKRTPEPRRHTKTRCKKRSPQRHSNQIW